MNAVNAVILERMQTQGRADPRACRPPHRRRRQADAADADARLRARCSTIPARATTSSPPRSSSSTPRPCSTTTSSTAPGMRRGKRTANLIWGNPASVLVGDFLFSRAFELMVEDGSLKVLKILSHASRGDRRGRGRPAHRAAPGRDQRGALSRTSSAPRPRRCSPPPAGSPPVVAEARRGGRGRARMPMAATSASPSSWSTTRSTIRRTRRPWARAVGDDFRDGKVTLPVILAYARGSDERPRLLEGGDAGRPHQRRRPRPRHRA